MPRKRSEVPWLKPLDGIYYVHYFDKAKQRTRRETLGTDDPQLAQVRFAEWLTTGARSARTVGPAGVAVAQALDWYYDLHVEKKVVDKERQANAITHLKAFFGTTKPLREIDKAQSRAYATARRKGEIGGGARRANKVGSDSTIRRELNVLNAAAQWCLGEDRIKADDLPRIDLPAETRATEAKWLPKETIRDALAAARSGRLHDFILLAYYWGARRESVERLLKTQVDMRLGVVDLHPPGTQVTAKRKPKVPIYPEIRPTIARLMDVPGPYLLGGGGQPLYREFVLLFEALGVEAWPHMLRHSRASHMLMAGEDPWKVAKLLGDTLATVERVYGHVSVGYLETKSGLG
jgi:integrase